MPEPKPITAFTGEFYFLSNFYMTNGKSVEHYFQASKFRDREYAEWVLDSRYPREAKQRGRKGILRPEWDQVRLGVMERLLRVKFQDPTLRAKLMATSPRHLEEGNHWGDRFWGTVNGIGENHLGRLLMKIRDEKGSSNG